MRLPRRSLTESFFINKIIKIRVTSGFQDKAEQPRNLGGRGRWGEGVGEGKLGGGGGWGLRVPKGSESKV